MLICLEFHTRGMWLIVKVRADKTYSHTLKKEGGVLRTIRMFGLRKQKSGWLNLVWTKYLAVTYALYFFFFFNRCSSTELSSSYLMLWDISWFFRSAEALISGSHSISHKNCTLGVRAAQWKFLNDLYKIILNITNKHII